jgi:hypothetical protein
LRIAKCELGERTQIGSLASPPSGREIHSSRLQAWRARSRSFQFAIRNSKLLFEIRNAFPFRANLLTVKLDQLPYLDQATGQALSALCVRHRVESLSMFGSGTTGKLTDDSDLYAIRSQFEMPPGRKP